MNSKDKLNWEKLFAFSDDNDRMEHEADMLSLNIALKVNKLLEDKDISKKELAKLTGTSAAYITQVLRGDKRVNMLFLAKVMNALDVKIDICFNNRIESDRELLNEALDIGIHRNIRNDRNGLQVLYNNFFAIAGR